MFKPRYFNKAMATQIGLLGQAVLGLKPLSLNRYDYTAVTVQRLPGGLFKTTTRPAFITKASVNPFSPLSSDLRISREKREKEFILLEENGLLESTVRFSISERKTLGVKNKSRQLSLLYKLDRMDLRKSLNALYQRQLINVQIPENNFVLGEFDQIFSVDVNGRGLEVRVTKQQIGDSFSNTVNNGNNYFKVVIHRIMEDYRNLLSSELPGEQTVRTVVNIPQGNYSQSTGLYIEEPSGPLWASGETISSNTFSEPLREEPELMGREQSVLLRTPEVEAPPQDLAVEHFLAFARLPASFTVLERNLLQIPNTVQRQNISENDIVTPAQNNTISADNIGINSGSIGFINTEQISYYSQDLGENELSVINKVVIKSRRTDWTVAQRNEVLDGDIQPTPNFIYSFFQNERSFSRVFVNTDYLTEALHMEVLQHIRACHSKKIIYNNMKFVSYEKKLWFGAQESIAKRTPIKQLDSREVTFRAMVLGTNPKLEVNVNTNLMLTAQFSESLTTMYRTNRYITSTAFSSVEDLADPSNQKFWAVLEQAFGKSIILFDYPKVSLRPAYLRGTVIECSDRVQVKGLVSNAGTEEGFSV